MGLLSSSKSKSSSKFTDNKVFGAEDGTTLGSHAVIFGDTGGVEDSKMSFVLEKFGVPVSIFGGLTVAGFVIRSALKLKKKG